MKDFVINEKVARLYWQDDVNCATVMLILLADYFAIELSSQIIDAAVGMHGAGGYRAQCGLLEGGLLFLGIWGRQRGQADDVVIQACRNYAASFEAEFSSLSCAVLRPQGFSPDNPPHLCEGLTCRAVSFTIVYIEELFC